ncbi:MAG: hypothetical protein ABSD13_05020 [Candidatus Korobacteraceae bacterium]|jgi:hypothetical protein
MSLGSVVAIPLLATLLLATEVATAQTGTSATSDAGAAVTQKVPARNAETESATAKTESADNSSQTEAEDESVIHATELRYERLFSLVLYWDQSAQQHTGEGQKKLAELLHARLRRTTGLSDDEAASVLQIVLRWREDVRNSSRKALEVVGAVRAANPGVHMDHTNSPEISAVYGRRWKITSEAIAQLQVVLGSKAFGKLDSFTYHMGNDEKAIH